MLSRRAITGPPTGTITFLFVDIEGSTKRWEHYPEAMRQALARHDALLRHTIEANHGCVFTAVGVALYIYIVQLASRNVMGGYVCGGVGEPCIPPENSPYFRSANNVTRGQASKIVGNAFFPGCSLPVKPLP